MSGSSSVPAKDSVVERVVRILDAFGPDDDSLSVTQVAARTGLHVATVSRLVGQLLENGLLTRDQNRQVGVGMRLWELAARAAPTRPLRDRALPFLEDLHSVVGHHAQLGILDGTDLMFVEKLSARDSVINYSRIAGRLPLHATSSGWLFLADADPCFVELVLSRPLHAYTEHTVTDPSRLRRAVADARRNGYAFNAGQVHPAATSVAAPIRDRAGRTCATVSVIVPNSPRARSTVPAVRACALGITRALLSR